MGIVCRFGIRQSWEYVPNFMNNELDNSRIDPRTFPSSVGLSILISDQIGEYSRRDLQKIAADIQAGVPHARDAFHYVYSRMMGWN